MTRKLAKIKNDAIGEMPAETDLAGSAHILAYILTMAGELAEMAADQRQGLLAYLLAMAQDEAERLSRDLSRPPT